MEYSEKKPLVLPEADELCLEELLLILWQGKWQIVSITFVFSILSLAYALNQPNIYRSEIKLAPALENKSSMLSGAAGAFGGLASIAGINIGQSNSGKVILALEVLQSRKFITDFVKRHDLLVPLIAARGWDASSSTLSIDGSLYDVESSQWLREPTISKPAEPTDQELFKAFRARLHVNKDRDTGMVLVSLEHYSPDIVRDWLMLLVSDLNNEMKQQDIQESMKSINYLKEQIEKVQIAEMRKILYQLIEEQSKVLMFAEVREEYIFKIVDPAVVPEQKVRPRRSSICVLGTMVGAMLSILFVFFKRFFIGRGAFASGEKSNL